MAETWNRVCIETREFVDCDRRFILERGKEYTTSPVRDGQVRVFSTFWFWAPVELFAGEKRFT